MTTWETLSSEYVIEDAPYLTLRRDGVRLPGGATIDGYWVIEQPSWVNVVAVTPDDQLVLIRQYRHAFGREGLEIPGGYVDDGEAPLAAARRELLEETGYGGGVWSALMIVAPNPALQDNLLHCFVARGVTVVGAPSLDENEQLTVELHPSSELPALIGTGAIHHALHVAPLLAFTMADGTAPGA